MGENRFAPSFMDGLPQAGAALAYAQELHLGQRRESDSAPYILHPLEVAALLFNTGHREAVVVAGILHDTVEDAGVPLEEIEDHFGAEAATITRWSGSCDSSWRRSERCHRRDRCAAG